MKINILLALTMLAGTAALAQGGSPPGGSEEPGGPGGPGMHRQGPGPGGPGIPGDGLLMPPGTWWRNADVVAKVGLTADQTRHIDQIFLDSRMQLIQIHASLEEEQLRLEAALNATPFDQGKAQVSIDKTADLRASLEKANAKMLLNIRAVLSPDQWTKLQALHGPGPGGGPQAEGNHGGKRPPGPQAGGPPEE